MTRVRWEDLRVKGQYRPELKPYYHDDLIAYDTETIDGRAILITDSKGNHIFPESLEDCLNFLTRRKYRSVMGWFKNIKYDTEAILKWCDEKTIKEFKPTCEMNIFSDDGKIELKYIPGKMLKITKNKHVFIFYDIGNFLRGALDDLANKYLGERKLKAPVEWSPDLTIDDFKTPAMLEYCKRDSLLTERLARVFMDACNSFGIFSKNYCSPASLATHYYLTKIDIPTLRDMGGGRNYYLKTAYAAYKGGFISSFKKGYFPKIYVYDINSAYPYAMTKLPNLAKGKFITGFREIPKDSYMGWFECLIESKPEHLEKGLGPPHISPVPIYVRKFNRNFYFAGRIKATITLLEYEALKNDFNITPLKGVFWRPTEDIEYLYADVVNELYKLKSDYKGKDKNLYSVVKTVLNGFYGKTIQKIPRDESNEFNTGNLFNPYHASYITAHSRIQVYEFIKRHGIFGCVGVMTDGVAMEHKVDEPLTKALGDWDLDIVGEAVFIGSGLYTVRSGDKVKTATRGFKITDRYDFFSLLANNLETDKITMPQRVRLSFKEALRLKKFDKWNLIEEGIKKININCDLKRDWVREFNNCHDALNSVIESNPYIVNMY